MLDAASLQRALVVVAHPNDIEFGAGGTVAMLTEAGVQVSYCLVTDGDLGEVAEPRPEADLVALRREEQRAAARCLDIEGSHFLGYRGGYLEVSLGLRRELARVIRQVRPDVVISTSPERSFDSIYTSHPDHLAVGQAVMCAVYPDARTAGWMPDLLAEGLQPWTVREMWLMGHPSVTDVVDVSKQLDRKLAALHCHASGWLEPAVPEAMARGLAAAVAEAAGLGPQSAAEGFFVMPAG